MVYYFKFNEHGKIRMCSDDPNFQPDMIGLDAPDTFTPEEMRHWKYIDGEFIYTPPVEPEPEPSPLERIAALEAELAAAKILLGVE